MRLRQIIGILQGEGRVRAIRAQYAETDKKIHEVLVSTGSFLRVAP